MLTGGKAIASGGFGCIFSPELKCNNSSSNMLVTTNDRISKLMINKYAELEYQNILKFKTILQNIPNYSNFFLLNDFTLCQPDKLTNNDLKSYNNKCSALKNKKITKKNINKSLHLIKSLNMPNGGVDIKHYLNKYNSLRMIDVNNSLINLLIHGILPMNKLNVYHADIKSGNILIKHDNNILHSRIIDWGISFYKTDNAIPANLRKRIFQYNTPFSVIIFNESFIKSYKKLIHDNAIINPQILREFILNYIFKWTSIRGVGHLNTINTIISKLTASILPNAKSNVKEMLLKKDFTYYYIIEYIAKILTTFTINNQFMVDDYYNNVFLKNIDIWGFMSIYIYMFEIVYNIPSLKNTPLSNKLKYIIIHFLFETSCEAINTHILIKNLHELNILFKDVIFDDKHKSIKLRKTQKMRKIRKT